MICIFTDGSTKGNGTDHSCGGWAYVICEFISEQHKCKFICGDSGNEEGTTNQRQELTAAINGLILLDKMDMFKNEVIHVYSDSAYLINCVNQKWYINWQKNGWKNAKKQPVVNQDLWTLLIPYFENSRFEFHKVAGHTAGNDWTEEMNNKVDEMAQNAAKELMNEK